jgi:hypothetical protein
MPSMPHNTTVPERYVEGMGVERLKPRKVEDVQVRDWRKAAAVEAGKKAWAYRVLREGEALPAPAGEALKASAEHRLTCALCDHVDHARATGAEIR